MTQHSERACVKTAIQLGIKLMGNLWMIEADLQACQETLFNASLTQAKHGLKGRLSVLCVNILEYTQRRGVRGTGGTVGF